MPIRRKKLMHYPCDDCGKKFERFGRYTVFCNECREKRLKKGQEKGVQTQKKKKSIQWRYRV